jgi:predicted dehydrogenase
MFATIPHGLDMQIGIIGAGGVTRGIHLPGFKLCADAEVTLVCDADRDATRAQLKIAGSPRDVMMHDRRWGYRYDQAFQFVESVKRGETRAPSFADGVRCQAVLDAALQSARERRWVEVA